jgi:hypothetical protein
VSFGAAHAADRDLSPATAAASDSGAEVPMESRSSRIEAFIVRYVENAPHEFADLWVR